MIIAIILPVYNHLDFTIKALNDLKDNLKQTHDSIFHVILVDDGSTDGTSEWTAQNHPQVHILKGDGNLWWSGAVNLGTKYALEKLGADYIILWNNDIIFESNYFPSLIQELKKKQFKYDYRFQNTYCRTRKYNMVDGRIFHPISGKYGMHAYFEPNQEKYEKIAEVDWLTGMGTVIPRSIIEAIGFWDNRNFPQYHGDSDFTYRAKLKGFKVIIHPALKLYNKIENSGFKHPRTFRQLLRLMKDNRSKSNFKRNLKFYRLYGKSYRAFLYLYWRYFEIFGGYFKWKVFELFGITKKRIN